jgi:hypothetical protein
VPRSGRIRMNLYEWINEMASKKITRLEVIDDRGRRYVEWNCRITESIQDEGRTLKIFVERNVK